MDSKILPLEELSIAQIFNGSEKYTYEIPVYQRNYAWSKEEITALVQDVYDAYTKRVAKVYYIGTLVTFKKDDNVYEVIDGQQRLTTIRILFDVFKFALGCKLTYKARAKSKATINAIPEFSRLEEKDEGIVRGYEFAKEAVEKIVSDEEKEKFKEYFLNMVHIIHYHVPKDIDLNHYFEIMNSRGEQLEKHEIVKAELLEKIHSNEAQKISNDDDKLVFNQIWECCSDMGVYIQQKFPNTYIFGSSLNDFLPQSFDEIVQAVKNTKDKAVEEVKDYISIESILNSKYEKNPEVNQEENNDSFQPIIDFSNFLLIVLKIIRLQENDFKPVDFNLDDKELLNEFKNAYDKQLNPKNFGYYLLKARFLLDNYVVHHSKEEDTWANNPWKLQQRIKAEDTRKKYLKNLSDDLSVQNKLVQLLSMFEVSFTARQRKNYLFYCLLYLINTPTRDVKEYANFVESLADNYFYRVYLSDKLNKINTPIPGAFDEILLSNNKLCLQNEFNQSKESFETIYGSGDTITNGITLFVFNYLDYRIWKMYEEKLRGEQAKEGSNTRKVFFEMLGCNDFGLDVFASFYFSRTRRSLEHYYPQANVKKCPETPDVNQINCLGNFAMIGAEANSSGSNWTPKTKLDHYLDDSGKIGKISVASLKFMIMMQMCKDKNTWDWNEIREHQDKMLAILF